MSLDEPGLASTGSGPAAAGERPATLAPVRTIRARRVHRIVRHVDPWSVLKLSALFYVCLYFIVLVAGVLLWQIGRLTDSIDSVEGFIADVGFTDFHVEGGQLLRASVVGGLVLVVAGTAANVLLVVLFNLISDVTGGVHMTVLEEDSARPAAPASGSPPAR